MKSKIVRQLGAMLLAGAMLVTSGNVTTYAAEQTDESVEVEETQEDELYGADMHFVDKIAEGDGYFICKEFLCGKEKYVYKKKSRWYADPGTDGSSTEKWW